MLHAMSGTAPPAGLDGDTHAVWIDLDRATEAERSRVTATTGLRVPSRHEVGEIESSSRLATVDGVLYLTMPVPDRTPDGALTVEPVGFVVSPDRLLTVRFAWSALFEATAEQWRSDRPEGTVSGLQPFLFLLEALVDRLADVLEHIGGEVDRLSGEVFSRGADTRGSSRRRDQFLQATLAEIGRKGGRASQLRDGLLGVSRIARYVKEAASGWLDEAEGHRLATLDRDVASLNDYEAQLSSKVQFLLDATLGFISIEQNNTIKVLTVVSIVGIPPTFVASLYGMNFKNMPELSWTYGYEYAWGLIVLSVLIPLLLFWRRGWL